MVETFEVTFIHEDQTIEVQAEKPILEAAIDAGIDLPYQCRMGVCGVCGAFRVEEGIVEQPEAMFLSMSDKEEGYVLTCIAEPRSDLTIDINDKP